MVSSTRGTEIDLFRGQRRSRQKSWEGRVFEAKKSYRQRHGGRKQLGTFDALQVAQRAKDKFGEGGRK